MSEKNQYLGSGADFCFKALAELPVFLMITFIATMAMMQDGCHHLGCMWSVRDLVRIDAA